jgi:hypothetical protein
MIHDCENYYEAVDKQVKLLLQLCQIKIMN